MNDFDLTCEYNGAAAGTAYWDLVFTNNTDHPITLQGYPRVVAITNRGDAWATSVSNPASPDEPVVVGTGGHSYSLLGVTNPSNYGNPATYQISWLLVTLRGHAPTLVRTPGPIRMAGQDVTRPTITALCETKA